MKNILCIVNPVSGLKKSLKVFYEVESKLKESNINLELFVSKYEGCDLGLISFINFK